MERWERIVSLLGVLIVYAVAVAFVSGAIYISIKNANQPVFVDTPCASHPALR